jgi:hypothetical protein
MNVGRRILASDGKTLLSSSGARKVGSTDDCCCCVACTECGWTVGTTTASADLELAATSSISLINAAHDIFRDLLPTITATAADVFSGVAIRFQGSVNPTGYTFNGRTVTEVEFTYECIINTTPSSNNTLAWMRCDIRTNNGFTFARATTRYTGSLFMENCGCAVNILNQSDATWTISTTGGETDYTEPTTFFLLVD